MCVCAIVAIVLIFCAGIGTSEGIAFDWINKRIYYSDYTNKTINSVSLDGSMRSVLAHVTGPSAIALDPCRGYVLVFFSIFKLSITKDYKFLCRN